MKRLLLLAIVLLVVGVAPYLGARARLQGDLAVTAGEFLVEPATLINLGFEWFVDGDANRTASVEVSYRKSGATGWQPALPLLRLNGERIRQATQLDVTVPNMFAGSILDLEPDTSYDAQFVLKDPDGVRGEARKIVTVRTRAEPTAGLRRRDVSRLPARFLRHEDRTGLRRADVRLQPDLLQARTGPRRAVRASRPGDTILVHAGVYQYNRLEYTNDPAVNRHDAAGRHVFPHRRRHGDPADRHQVGRRR